MMFLKLLVKILLLIMDLNIVYKMSKKPAIVISENSRNPILYSVLARHTPSSFPYLLFYYTTFDHNNLNLPAPALHTFHPSATSRIPPNDVCEEV